MDNIADTNVPQTPTYPMSASMFDTHNFGSPINTNVQEAIENPQTYVSLQYGVHTLFGKLYMVTAQHFMEIQSRFYDISPNSLPRLDDEGCDPWTLLHATLGLTWIDIQQLPAGGRTDSATPALEGSLGPSLVALTDNFQLFTQVTALGHCDTDGNLALAGPTAVHADDLIIALSSRRPFQDTRKFEYPRKDGKTSYMATKQIADYPPLAVPPKLMSIIDRINSVSEDPSDPNNFRFGQPKKSWLKNVLPNFQGSHLSGYLGSDHALYRHRGNEAVFPRDLWHAVCYPVSFPEDNAVAKSRGTVGKIPEPYWQKLFEDLQGRERVEGTDRLKRVDTMYYEPGPGDNQNAATEEPNEFELDGNAELYDIWNDPGPGDNQNMVTEGLNGFELDGDAELYEIWNSL